MARAAQLGLGLRGVEHRALLDDLAAQRGQAFCPQVALDKLADVAQMHAQHQRGGGITLGDLLQRQHILQLVRAEAAIGLGHGERQQARRTQIGEVLEGERGIDVVLWRHARQSVRVSGAARSSRRRWRSVSGIQDVSFHSSHVSVLRAFGERFFALPIVLMLGASLPKGLGQ